MYEEIATLSRLHHAVHVSRALLAAVVVYAAGALAPCFVSKAAAYEDKEVDTDYQTKGITPRIELEIGPQFVYGLGHACRNEPVANGDEAKTACESGFPLLGGQALLILRPVRHWGIGVFYAYDGVLGAHEVYIDKEATMAASYKRTAQRLGLQLRWYSRSVQTSGFYFALHVGAIWWSDKVKPITDDDAISQVGPEYGFELGGVFAPFRGLGMTMALQSWMMWLHNSPQRNTSGYGSTYGYGPFAFAGFVWRFQLGFSL